MSGVRRDVAHPSPPATVVVPPSGAIGVAGLIAGDTVGALKQSPVLLLVVVLNIAMLVASAVAAWAFVSHAQQFLITQESYRHTERTALGALLERCLDKAGGSP